jgi:type VI secretion system secreted protein VgrG
MPDLSDLIDTDRSAWVTTPLPEGHLVLESFSGHEGLSVPFVFELSLLSRSQDVGLAELLGQPMTVHLTVLEGERQFNGMVVHAEHGVPEGEYNRYRVTLCSWLSFLSYTTNCRIFQNKSAVDVIKEVFRDNNFSDFEDALGGDYVSLDYCVQYRESDFNFVSRLMEQEGIYYFFKHEDSKHTLVLADGPGAHTTTPGYEEVSYKPPHEVGDGDHIDSWIVAQQIQSGSFAATDFDFIRPRADLMSQLALPLGNARDDFALYDYPGKFLTTDGGSERVKVRLQAAQVSYAIVAAGGDTRGLGAGDLFTLADFPRDDQNKEYLITSANYHMHAAVLGSGSSGGSDRFNASYTLIDSQTQFRSPPNTRKPRVEGVQTAIVVGESGDEITTDNYGRVKVQFHWDRDGKKDENSSCWIRVAQLWAGSGWGGIHIPRIGQEVIVDFLEGDPDRPIITGRVYNGDNMPPYALPDNKTQSGIKSRSSKGGAPSNFNELRFEDKMGSELVSFQAEKDLASLVKHDEDRSVGNDRTTAISHDEAVNVGNNRTELVGKQESITIGGDRQESVGKSETVTIGTTRALTVGTDETIQVGGKRADAVAKDETTTVGGNQSLSVGKNQSIDVGGGVTLSVAKDNNVTISGNLSVDVSKGETRSIGKKLTVTANDQITFTSGSASITLKSNGDITIKGANITLDGSGKINIKASSDVVIKGSKVSQN